MAYAAYRQYASQRIHGFGFVLTPDDPYVAVDIDSCVQDEELNEKAVAVIAALGSYSEISPSGRGVHVLVACLGFQHNRRRQEIEIYSHSRYVSITGHHIAGAPTAITPVSLNAVASLVTPEATTTPPPTAHELSRRQYTTGDAELWERIFAYDKYGAHHLRRFQGDSSLDRGDHSFTVRRYIYFCSKRFYLPGKVAGRKSAGHRTLEQSIAPVAITIFVRTPASACPGTSKRFISFT